MENVKSVNELLFIAKCLNGFSTDINGYSIQKATKNNYGVWNLTLEKYIKEGAFSKSSSSDVAEIADRLINGFCNSPKYEVTNFQKESENEFWITIERCEDAENEKKDD